MVATRRGVRVISPAKTEPEQAADVQATPSGRRTRSTVKQVGSPTQHAPVDACSHLEKNDEGNPLQSPRKRCTRASRLHSPEQPSTPVGSTHEADVSDMESCCSTASNTELPVTRSTRSRRRQPRAAHQEDEEVSEVESCCSAVSASKPPQSSRRSTRRKMVPESSDVEKGDAKAEESCSSVASQSQRVTRSQRKTRSKQQTEDSELSDAESCASSVSGAEVSKSTTRISTRSRRQPRPIPMHLDEPSDSSQSSTPTGRRTRAARGKAAADVSEPQSDGFESGPTYSVATRRRNKAAGPKAVDSDSEVTDVHSPVGSPTRGRGTPCSSRTGSGSSSRGAPTSRRSVRDITAVKENVEEPAEEDESLNDSRLENTVITEDADRTLVEEEKSQIEPEEPKAVDDLGKAGAEKAEKEASDSPVCAEEAVKEPAVINEDQQEEPSTENEAGDTSEMERMQETAPSSEPVQPRQSVTVTVGEKASEPTEDTEENVMEAADVEASQADEPLDAAEETRPGEEEEEEMEVSTLEAGTQQVVESIQVTSGQQQKVTVDSESEQEPKDVVVQKKQVISLLDSSDEEEDDDEDEEGEASEEEEEDWGSSVELRGETYKKPQPAAASVEGLFMIDTRPGQDADEQYYKDGRREEEATTSRGDEQEEEDEEFVDEEGDDDEDDEDAQILFSSRDFRLKELSSRIDPGIRVKQLGGLYISFDGSKSKPVSSSLQKLKEKKIQDEVMKKSVIGPDFEKKDAVPPYTESKQKAKLKRREEREKTTGGAWFNMKAPELTQELKGDLQVLKMRGSMDPKRFYKKNDRDGFPKYFQVGTVVDNPVDFYHSRVPKKERKRTMVEELMADAEFRHNNKKRYQHILAEKAAQGAGKRNKKKNKFHKK